MKKNSRLWVCVRVKKTSY